MLMRKSVTYETKILQDAWLMTHACSKHQQSKRLGIFFKQAWKSGSILIQTGTPGSLIGQPAFR